MERVWTETLKLRRTELLLLLQPKRPLTSVLTLPALGAGPVRMPVLPRAPYISTAPAHGYIPPGELLQPGFHRSGTGARASVLSGETVWSDPKNPFLD